MGFFSSQLLKSIEWLDDNKDVLVYRYPMNGKKIMMGSKLTVRESQVAIFVDKGKVADVFEPGMYKLSTSNLPFLTAMLSLPYGFKSPFTSEVYFISTKQFTNQKWGTSNPIAMRDKEFGTIRIRGYGSYSFKVDEPSTFLKELFGTNSSFKTEDIASYLRSLIVTSVSDTIASSKISAIDLAANLEEFGDAVLNKGGDKLKNLGLKLVNFNVENISFPEEIEKAIDTRASMGVLSDQMDTFMKYQTANALRDASKNSSGNMATAGVQLGAGVALSGVMTEQFKNSKKESSGKVEKINCPKCKAEIRANAKFCPECGTKISVNFCKECGTKATPGAKFCSECGAKLK